jgi:WhiB family transcriptional regulator, redox-sensing transcriptional regulator
MTAIRTDTFPLRARTAEAWDWQLSARCRGEDPSIFFHPDGERGHKRKRRQRRAKDLCNECPVAIQCRQHALTFHERFGTWGGLSEDERDKLAEKRRDDLDERTRMYGFDDRNTVAGM